jgi:hypothetical protein
MGRTAQLYNLEPQPAIACERSCQLVEQCLGIPEVGAVEALGEPAIDRQEKVRCLGTLALVSPKPGEAGRGAELPKLGPLLAGESDGAEKAIRMTWPDGLCRSPIRLPNG